MNAIERLEKDRRARALLVLTLLLVAKMGGKQAAKTLKISMRTMATECGRIKDVLCRANDPDRMRWALINACKEGLEELLYQRYKDHKLIGKHLRPPVQGEVRV